MEREALKVPGFLIAEPSLEDPNFFQTVIALISHDSDGSFGLVLNRQINIFLKDILEEYGDLDAGTLPVFLGGPVEQNRLFTMHSGDPGILRSAFATQLAADLVFEPDFGLVDEFLRGKRDAPRAYSFYLGYSGWGPGQLDAECKDSTWIPSSAEGLVAFSGAGEAMWKLALSKKGPYYGLIGQTGYRPSLN